MIDFNKFIYALELVKMYSKGGETLNISMSCMQGDFTFWLSGSDVPENEYDSLEHVIEELLILNRDQPKFNPGDMCYMLHNDSFKQWMVESIYWDKDLIDYRMNLVHVYADHAAKASVGQSMCFKTLGDLFDGQIERWKKEKAAHQQKQHALDAQKYYEGFGYKKTCTENQDSLTRDDCHVKEAQECEHEEYVSVSGKPMCRKCLAIYPHTSDICAQECAHESDGQEYCPGLFEKVLCASDLTPKDLLRFYKCKKCGEFYR